MSGNVTHCPPRRASAPVRSSPPPRARFTNHGDPARARWYVVSIEPNAEFRVRDRLSRDGFSPWLPECVVKVRHRRFPGFVEHRPGPLFPGYLFLAADLNDERWARVEETHEVDRLLCWGGRPAAVPDRDMTELRRLVDAEGGRIVIERGNVRRRFAENDQVRLTGGAYEGWVGLYVAQGPRDRINILLDMLGAARVVSVEEALVMPA